MRMEAPLRLFHFFLNSISSSILYNVFSSQADIRAAAVSKAGSPCVPGVAYGPSTFTGTVTVT